MSSRQIRVIVFIVVHPCQVLPLFLAVVLDRLDPNEQEIWDESTIDSYAHCATYACALCVRTLRTKA